MRRNDAGPPLVLFAATKPIAATPNRTTWNSRGTGGPATVSHAATAASTTTAAPAKKPATASGYCTIKNGTVPASASGKSVTVSFSPLCLYLTVDAPKTAATRIDDSRMALSRSATTDSSAAAIKHSAATASLRCSTLRSASQMTATAATV